MEEEGGVDFQSSGALWKSRWPSWAPVPNKPYGFCGHNYGTMKEEEVVDFRGQELYENRDGRLGLLRLK